MAAIDELLEHYRKRHDQILADVKVWRDNGYKLHITIKTSQKAGFQIKKSARKVLPM